MRRTSILLVNLALGWMFSCIEPFPIPELATNQTNILVVNSFLNTGMDTIIVKLSRTKAIGAKGTPPLEANAIVTLEDDAGGVYSIPQRVKGEYFRRGMPINPKSQFRLRIKTSDKREYQSEVVSPLTAPPIDNLTSKVTDLGVDIYLDTHDPNSQIHYYRWDYLETYEYTSAFRSNLVYDKVAKAVLERTNANQIYRCWSTAPSPSINVGSTAQLTQDVFHNILLHIPSSSSKTIVKYSMLVRQYAVNKSEFEYWNNVKKISESQGTLFDPQPAELQGNLVCTSDASANVLGYFSSGTVTEKRVFVLGSDLPKSWHRVTDYDDCFRGGGYLDWVRNDSNLPSFKGYLINQACDPDQPPCDLGVSTPGYTTAPSQCIDCTLRLNGKTAKPSYWD